jgi:hypothetical protein
VPRWIDKPYNEFVIASGEADTSLTIVNDKWYNGGGAAIEYDENGYGGKRNIRVIGTGGATTIARMSKPVTNITGYDMIKLTYKMEDSCKSNSSAPLAFEIRVLLATTLTRYRGYYYLTRNKVFTKDKWHEIALPLARPAAETGGI